jgi:hypothetical protein
MRNMSVILQNSHIVFQGYLRVENCLVENVPITLHRFNSYKFVSYTKKEVPKMVGMPTLSRLPSSSHRYISLQTSLV